jgi:hypothetical protein
MVSHLTNCTELLYINSSSSSTPSVIKGVKQETLDKLPEKLRKHLLANVEVTNQVLEWTSWLELIDWEYDVREQIYRHIPEIQKLRDKDINFESIKRVMVVGRVPLEKMLALEPEELKNIICRPNPDPILRLLENGVNWDSLMKLDPQTRDKLLSHYQQIVELLALVSWDDINNLPPSLYQEILPKIHLLRNWIEAGVQWKEIANTDVKIFKSLFIKPFGMTALLSCASWREIISLESNMLTRALNKSATICEWIENENISLKDCLERLKLSS